MPSLHEIATEYANRVRASVVRDQVGDYMTKSAFAGGGLSSMRINLIRELAEIGGELNKLVYERPASQRLVPATYLSEEDKDEIADETARQLGITGVPNYRYFIKGGSLDSLMQVAEQIETIYQMLTTK